MQYRIVTRAALALGLTTALALMGTATFQLNAAPALTTGKVDLKSAGALAFGPDGVLFVGDSLGGAVVAIDTGDKTAVRTASINVQGVDQKIAALVGVLPDQILVNDIAVNPISKNVYVSASRGRGPDAMPLVVKIEPSGKVTPLSLDNSPRSAIGPWDSELELSDR